MNLHKGDNVKILSGKDRGKTGTILHALPAEDRIVIDGLNLFKKRSRPKRQGEKGQTVTVPRPMPASKVMLICSSCKQPTRVGWRVEGAKKVRYCKKCKFTIEYEPTRKSQKKRVENIPREDRRRRWRRAAFANTEL